DAVDVLAAVQRQRPARLEVIGRGPAGPEILRRARQLGVADRVAVDSWKGPAALAAAYQRMHVVLVPSVATATWVEQFGRVLLEAAASGAVVAGYASGAIPEVAPDAALLVPEGDVDGLAAAVCNALTDSHEFCDRRGRLIAHCRSFDWSEIAGAEIGLYERVAS